MPLRSAITYLLLPLLFLLIYHQVFIADYAYLDEIHQLWHNNDNSNFVMFHTQGRWLTGLLFQKLFASITTIEELKWLRLFSLAGWVLTALVWSALFKKWMQWLLWPASLWWLGSLFVVCSISTAIYIGWASCMEVFAGVLAALISGHLLFKHLYVQKNTWYLSSLTLLASMVLGIISLFIYQTAFGVFLLPFFFQYLQQMSIKLRKELVIGVVFYLLVYAVYYFLFQYSLQVYNMEASTRTAVNINFLKKLSFFFSGPLPQGFSLNALFSASSIISQVFYPLILVVWVLTVFKRRKENPVAVKLLFIAVVLFLLALIYLPLMIASENFPSYRTLFAFNLAVFVMVMETLLHFCNAPRKRKVFTVMASLWLVSTGFYAFNFQYVYPLKREYAVLKNFMQQHYRPGLTDVHFIRADKMLFTPYFATRVYRDEFGAPSTYRDWVPEPIIKQMVFEITGNRAVTEQVNVVQYEKPEDYRQAGVLPLANTLVVDMNTLFTQKK